MMGTVVSWCGTYGFINPDDWKDDVFVHYSGIVGEGFRELASGQRVKFEIQRNGRRHAAYDVSVIEA